MDTLTMFRRALASAALVVGLGAVAQGAQAASYGGLVIFGDSLSDPGNNAALIGAAPAQTITGNSYVPALPYASGQYSNGDVWAKAFAASIGLSGAGDSFLTGGGNYAFGGSRVSREGSEFSESYPSSVKTVVNNTVALQSGVLPGDFLYVVEGGGNDARDTIERIGTLLFLDPLTDIVPLVQQAADLYANDMFDIVHTLENAGAQHLVVWNTPNLGLAPAVQVAGAGNLGAFISNAMSEALANKLAGDSHVKLFDVFGLLTATVLTPGHNGFSNVTDACGAAVNACDPLTALFWDGVHPTAAGHQFLAQGMYSTVVPLPQSSGLLLVGMVLVARKLRRRG